MLNTIIERTETIAVAYLTGLGFGEEQVAPLMTQARKDLETEFARLDALRHAPDPDPEGLDRSLHAIKGLLFNLGTMRWRSVWRRSVTRGRSRRCWRSSIRCCGKRLSRPVCTPPHTPS